MVKVTCQLEDYSSPAMPCIKVHNNWCLPNCPAQTEECFKSSKLEICAKRWLNYLKEEVTNA